MPVTPEEIFVQSANRFEHICSKLRVLSKKMSGQREIYLDKLESLHERRANLLKALESEKMSPAKPGQIEKKTAEYLDLLERTKVFVDKAADILEIDFDNPDAELPHGEPPYVQPRPIGYED